MCPVVGQTVQVPFHLTALSLYNKPDLNFGQRLKVPLVFILIHSAAAVDDLAPVSDVTALRSLCGSSTRAPCTFAWLVPSQSSEQAVHAPAYQKSSSPARRRHPTSLSNIFTFLLTQ